MVAVVTGNGLGLFSSVNNTLHSSGQNRLGQAGGESFVNITNGNLVLRFLDERLSGSGLDITALRTYNSLGETPDSDGDQWRWQGERSLSLSGSVNTPGSAITRMTGDGHKTVYNWSATSNRYESSEGDGAADFITWNSSTSEWVWVDGSDLVADTYNAAGRLLSQQDRHGNKLLYGYDTDGRLASVEDWGSKQKIVFSYAPVAANPSLTRLQRLDTYSLVVDGSGWPTGVLGAMVTQVNYGYDSLGRLTSVATDLTPGTDNSTADGKVYLTAYTYDGNSLRVTSVSQSDGTRVQFSYYQDGRIQSVIDSEGMQTFNYGTGVSSVTNALGQVWTYRYDNEGKLISTQTPMVNGQVITNTYAYDAKGNLTESTDGLGNKITYGYDANDNCTYERDSLGNTITRTYDANNQVLTETRYLKPDPDGAGSQTAAEPLTQRYVYDAQGRLRFFVSAQGRVTEYRYSNLINASNSVNGVLSQTTEYASKSYDLSGLTETSALTESQLISWAGAQRKDLVQSTSYTYDWRGNLSSVIEFSKLDSQGGGSRGTDIGAVITEYIYDEYGQLLQTIARRGANKSLRQVQSSVVYDGLGRQLSVMNQGATKTYAYNGAAKTISESDAAGLITTSTYDSTGRVVRVEGGGRKSYQYYDKAGRLVMTLDPLGNREYLFYDVLGRIQFSVDTLGGVTENQYDKNNQLTKQTQFNNLANTASWFNGSAVTKASLTTGVAGSGADIITDKTKDRVVQYQYDFGGRLISEINPEGVITNYSYDGMSRQIKSQTSSSAIRNFYDADGLLMGVLDQEGYLRENIYDSAGRLVQSKRYAGVTTDALRGSGTFAELKSSLSSTTELNSYYFYDVQGRIVGAVDEKGFLTETVYDENNVNTGTYVSYAKTQVKAYKVAVVVATTDTLATLRNRAGSSVVTEKAVDEFSRINREVAMDGTTTNYEYDAASRIIRAVVGQGQTESDGTSSSRAIRNRYNVFGELTGQVSGVGEATLSNAPTADEINQAIATYGQQRVYDATGRVSQTIDANGKKTLFYYDAKDQLRFSVDATGAVKEINYNTFGQVSGTRAFDKRLTDMTGLNGGALTTTVLNQFNALANPGFDRTTSSSYDRRGLQTNYTDANGYASTYGYTALGQLASETNSLGSAGSVTSIYAYNRRGELTSVIRDNGGLTVKTGTTYDAFGRIASTKDAMGRITSYTYDNNGRTITLVDPLNRSIKTDYDMLGRVLKRTDAAGNNTSYVYDDVNRSVRVTTPEGTSITNYNDRHGQTLKVVDALGNQTKYSYDKNGNVTQITDALNQVVAANQYDNAGRLIISTDAKGIATQLTYDDVNRVLSRTVDPTGVNIRTEYKFNSHGETIETIDAAGTPEARTTRYEYDRKGQLTRMTTDPEGLGLRTDFSYDALGNQVLVTRGSLAAPNQTMSQYSFDKLGRRTAQVNAYGTLNLTTQYKYDANGNLTRTIDENGNSTWYVYDADNRLTHSINQLGEVSETQYDQAGNVYQTIQYAARISASIISSWASVNVLSGVIPTVTAGADQVTRHQYDKNGRLKKTIIDPANLAITTEYQYDANNNLIRKIDANGNSTTFTYDKLNRLTETITDPDNLALTTRYFYDAKGNLTRTIDANGNSNWSVYDGVGRKTHSINAMGEMTGYEYDDLGNVTQTRQYDTRLTAGEINGLGNVINSFNPVTSSRDLVTNHAYDAAGRLIRTVVDPTNFALTTEYRYDARGNLTRKINAQGNSEWYVYDTANRQIFNVNAVGDIKGTEYTADGKVRRTTEYATALSVTQVENLVDVNSQIPVTTSSDDSVTEYTYDAAGRVSQKVVDPSGLQLKTQYRYDAGGNLTRTIDANGNSTWYVYDNADHQIQTINALGGVSDTQYDAAGRIVKAVSYGTSLSAAALSGLNSQDQVSYIAAQTNAATDHVTYYAYDKADRLRFSVDALGGITETQYTASGKLSQSSKMDVALTTSQLNDLNSAVNARANTEDLLVAITVASPKTTTHYTYDLIGRLTQTVLDPLDLNITTQYRYDAMGRLTRTIDANGNSTWNIYNSTGNLYQTVDATGAVVRYGYKNGQLIYTQNHYFSINTAAFDDVAAPVTIGTSTADEITYYSYDKAGRLQFETSRVNYNYHATKENRYDAKGNLVATIAYEKYIYNFSSQMTAALADNKLTSDEVATQISMLGYSATNMGDARITRYAYDANDRLRFTIDAAGYVSENTYDSIGNILQQTDYAVAINTTSYTEDTVDLLLNKTHIKNQTTRYSYDALGRLSSSTDALNYSEYNQYDRFGNKVAYTNKRGHTWLYSYDRANRLVEETSPVVEVASTSENHSVSAQNVNLVTRLAYDLNGNLLSRTEGILRLSDGAEDASQARTTQYEYDKANRQTKTILAGWFDPATGKVESSNAAGRFQRTTEVTYDAMGNAVRNKIRTGVNEYTYQTKVYDQLGRVTWDIDALNQVTAYIYDALGQQSIIYSYDSHIGDVKNAGVLYSQAQMASMVTGFASRIIYNYFDALGRKTEVRQERVKTNYITSAEADTNEPNITVVNGQPATQYSYDAVGNVTLMRKVIKGISGTSLVEYANQWSFYNNRNQKIQDVFDINATEGYVTNYDYDAQGNLIQQTEFASKVTIPTSGLTAPITPPSHDNDRFSYYAYDAMNRLVEIRGNLEFIVNYTGELYSNWTMKTIIPLQTTTYDAIGNITSQSEQGRNATYTEYDALGRATKITLPSRKTANASKVDPFSNQVDASPELSYRYNAFGQRVEEKRSAGGGRGLASGDVTITTRFDVAGNAVSIKNALNNVIYSEFDASGRMTREYYNASENFENFYEGSWSDGNYNYQIEKRYEYDLLGHQTAAFDIYLENGIAKKSGKQQTFNRFGEVAADAWVSGNADNSGTMTTSITARYSYDDAGRLTSKYDAVDGTTRYFYDSASRNTRIEQQGNNSTDDGTSIRVTEFAYDKLGRVLTNRAPEFSATTTELSSATMAVTPTIRQTYDRWGNVISKIDVNGSEYTYEYNRNNQLIRETSPVSTVVNVTPPPTDNSSDGQYIFTPSSETLVREFQYSGTGFMMREINKSISDTNTVKVLRERNYRYNAVGQLTSYTDGTKDQQIVGGSTDGVRTEYAYDAFGNQIGTRNEFGTVTVDNFDAAGNQLSHGILRKSNTSSVNNVNDYYYSSNVGSSASTFNPQVVLLQSYIYDNAGRRTGSYQGGLLTDPRVRTAASGFGWQFYSYDQRNNIVKTRNELGITVKINQYDDQNHLVREEYANGNYKTWQYDALGRMTSHVKLQDPDDAQRSAVKLDYTYNDFGQQISEIESVWNIYTNQYTPQADTRKDFIYLENGLLGEVHQIIDDHISNVTSLRLIKSTYHYDIVGRKTYEKQETIRPYGNINTSFESYSSYDNLGRLSKSRTAPGKLFYNPDNNAGEISSVNSTGVIEFQYDALSNRALTLEDGIVKARYLYDTEGRMTYQMEESDFANGIANGNLHQKASPKLYQYDKIGQLRFVQDVTPVAKAYTNVWYVNQSRVEYTTQYTDYRINIEQYEYTDLGNQRNSYAASVDANTWVVVSSIPYSGGFAAHGAYDANKLIDWNSSSVAAAKYWKEAREYDAKGRATLVSDPRNSIHTTYTYRADGSLLTQLQEEGSAKRVLTSFTDYDSMGNLLKYNSQTSRYVPASPFTMEWKVFGTDRYENTYAIVQDGYAKKSETLFSSNGSVVITDYTYGIYGELAKITSNPGGGQNYTRKFVTDRDGHLLFKIEINDSEGTWSETNIFANGQQIGTVSDKGGVRKTNFIQGITGATNGSNDLTPGTYAVRASDTLQSIAQSVWGDSSLWYLIADANGVNADANSSLTNYANQNFKIPNVTRAVHNNSSTFKPYNPADTIGSTTPFTVPVPPPTSNSQCSKATQVIVTVLIIAVAAVVTVATAGAALTVLAPGAAAASGGIMAAGIAATSGAALVGASGATAAAVLGAAVIGGMAGSAASQLLKMSFGMQDTFSGRDLLKAGVMAGFGSAAGGALGAAGVTQSLNDAKTLAKGLGSFGVGFAKGAATYAVSNMVNNVIGSDSHAANDSQFDWGNLLIAGISSGVGGAVGAQYGKGAKGAAQFAKEYASSMTSGAANAIGSNIKSAHENRSVQGYKNGKIDCWTVAADSFGNTLGSKLVSKITDTETEVKLKNELQKQLELKIASNMAAEMGDSLPPAEELFAQNDLFYSPAGEELTPDQFVRTVSNEPTADGFRNTSPLMGPDTPPTNTYKVRSGDNYEKIAREMLGKDAKNSEVLEYTKKLVSLNKDKTIKPGQELVLPNESTQISDEGNRIYNEMDKDFQQYKKEQQQIREAARQKQDLENKLKQAELLNSENSDSSGFKSLSEMLQDSKEMKSTNGASEQKEFDLIETRSKNTTAYFEKNGRRRDTETGRFTKAPEKMEQILKNREKIHGEREGEVILYKNGKSIELPVFDATGKVIDKKNVQLNLGAKGDINAGWKVEAGYEVKMINGRPVLTKAGVKFETGVEAKITYVEGKAQGTLGNSQNNVKAKVEVDVSSSATVYATGELYVKLDPKTGMPKQAQLEGTGGAQAALLQGKISGETEITIMGVKVATVKAEAEGQAVAVGLSYQGGVMYDGKKFKIYAGGGAAAFFGGKVKGGVEINVPGVFQVVEGLFK